MSNFGKLELGDRTQIQADTSVVTQLSGQPSADGWPLNPSTSLKSG